MRPIGILGGTFDPVHNGHLRPALELLEGLDLQEIRFIPCRQPPHRSRPEAAPGHRLAMLEQAIAGQAGFVLDDREMRRDGPSYMVDTLASLRAQMGKERPLCLITGRDAFQALNHWERWREILKLAHLVAPDRPGATQTLPNVLNDLLKHRQIQYAEALSKDPAGAILLQPVTQLAISATEIRALLTQGRSPRYLLPEAVWTYIRDQDLYRSPALLC